jgi:MFS transporter, DHA1 family, multidrug resistance protein
MDRRNLLLISFSQFAAAFAFNFVMTFLPFYILRISPYSSEGTLLWIGAIIGSSGIVTALTSTFWGSLTHYFSPKMLYLRGILIHTLMFVLMGFTTDLYALLFLRIIQGLTGGVSTIGFIIVSSSSPSEKIPEDLGIFQSCMTVGQLLGPPLGSFAAAAFGYRWAFLAASVVLLASFVFCWLYVKDVPRLPRGMKSFEWPAMDRRILAGWGLCFAAQVQIVFLPSVLPNVFEGFRIEHDLALKLAGIIVMIYTVATMVGTYVWSRLSRRVGLHKMITLLFAGGIVLQALLALSRGIVDFTVIRMVQTGVIAATIPMVISLFLVAGPKGSTVGFLNSARFAGNAVGPMMATSVLAFSSLPALYLMISGLTLVAFLSYRSVFK